MSGSPLSYDIISCSSKNQELIEKYSLSPECKTEGNEICWFTKSGHSYPQSLVLKLEEPSLVGRIDVTAHPMYLPSSMTIAFGMPDDRFRNSSGKSYNASYIVASQFSFVEDGVMRETRSVYCDHTAVFIRFTVHGFLDSPENPGCQIGLLSIVIRGFCGSSSSFHPDRSIQMDLLGLTPSTAAAPYQYKRPVSSEYLHPTPIMVHFDSDSDDEEVLFTREMITRLDRKARQLQASRPESALSDSGMSSSSSKGEEQKSKSSPSEKKKAAKVVATQTGSPEHKKIEELVTPATAEPQLSPRTISRVLAEIAAFGEDLGLESVPDEKKGSKTKKYYFGRRMAELNNTIRILEAKKEQAIWKEQYSFAAEIDRHLTVLRAREVPLKELLIDRMDALEKNDYHEAQRLKNRFDANMENAVSMPGLEKFLSEKEMNRLRYEAGHNKKPVID